MDLNRLDSGKKLIDQILNQGISTGTHEKTPSDKRKNPYTPATRKK